MAIGGDVECRAGEVARAFFEAATKLSEVTGPLDRWTLLRISLHPPPFGGRPSAHSGRAFRGVPPLS